MSQQIMFCVFQPESNDWSPVLYLDRWELEKYVVRCGKLGVLYRYTLPEFGAAVVWTNEGCPSWTTNPEQKAISPEGWRYELERHYRTKHRTK